MQPIDDGSPAHGYAEILCTDGSMALLRGHALREADSRPPEHLYYAITDSERVVFVAEESDLAWRHFNALTRRRADRLGDEPAEQARQDFLATQPTSLPTLRGAAYRKLASQAAGLSRGSAAGTAPGGGSRGPE